MCTGTCRYSRCRRLLLFCLQTRRKKENVGNQLVVNVVDEMKPRVVVGDVVAVICGGLVEARHYHVWDSCRDSKNAWSFWSGAVDALSGSL